MIETKFLSDEAPRKSVHYAWIAFIISILLWEWEKKESSTSLLWKIQIQNKENKDA